jgi:hypothetical protein
VSSRTEARFLERLHQAMAIFAAHELRAFCEGFVEGAWQPAPTHPHLADQASLQERIGRPGLTAYA